MKVIVSSLFFFFFASFCFLMGKKFLTASFGGGFREGFDGAEGVVQQRGQRAAGLEPRRSRRRRQPQQRRPLRMERRRLRQPHLRRRFPVPFPLLSHTLRRGLILFLLLSFFVNNFFFVLVFGLKELIESKPGRRDLARGRGAEELAIHVCLLLYIHFRPLLSILILVDPVASPLLEPSFLINMYLNLILFVGGVQRFEGK